MDKDHEDAKDANDKGILIFNDEEIICPFVLCLWRPWRPHGPCPFIHFFVDYGIPPVISWRHN
jgi:hypothetical protein